MPEQCKIADNCSDLDAYGVDAKDVKVALETREPTPPFKNDEEFGQDLISRCDRADAQQRTPTPPPYDGCTDAQRA